MTTEVKSKDQWPRDAERITNIRAMIDVQCWQIKGIAHEKWLVWWLHKAVVVGLSQQREVSGDERREVLERIKTYIAITPPEKRCACEKRVVVLKAKPHMGSCDRKPALISKESELRKVEEWELVQKRQPMDFAERFEQRKLAAQWVSASRREARTTPPHRLLRTAQNNRGYFTFASVQWFRFTLSIFILPNFLCP